MKALWETTGGQVLESWDKSSVQTLGVRYSKPEIKVLRDRHDIIEEKLFKSV